MEMLPGPEEQARSGDDRRGSNTEKAMAPASSRNLDKVKCLDGLRGIACVVVFSYHFLWPWTPAVMLGYGAMPPLAPEPYTSWFSFPILCLLNRGRPMVAIFFAISGYVLTRHILRAIHERRLETAYRSIASAVFRRAFRLYLPPTISMFLVAVLAQVGVFRSEEDIYQGPDSFYINGTVTVADMNTTCANGTTHVTGAAGIVDSLGLSNPVYWDYIYSTNWTDTSDWIETSAGWYNVTGWPGNATLLDTLCFNTTSKVFGPSSMYSISPEAEIELSNGSTVLKRLEPRTLSKGAKDEKSASLPSPLPLDTGLGMNYTNITTQLKWVQFGGSWEEHPFIHDNATYALQNFTRAYAEWANPFNFGHYHTRYDPHTFTIPMEFRGSMFIYIFLLGTAALKAKWRLRFGAFLSMYSLVLGRWDMATFMGGTVMSELDIRRSDSASPENRNMAAPVTNSLNSRRGGFRRPTRDTALRWASLVVALYLLSYPDAAAEHTPGFIFLASWVPRYYIALSGWMFYQSMGALILLRVVLSSPTLRGLLERPAAQYLGKISFSLYLVHGPVLHSLGFWIMPRLFERFSQPMSFIIGWVVLFSVSFYLAGLWYRKIDLWSATVGRKMEKLLTD